jgi:nucleotide-binding universal stress UspA family protein
MSPLKNIVVAVDLSETAADTIDAALDLARLHHGHVHFLHVVPDPFHLPYTIEPTGVNWSDVLQRWTEDAHTQLDHLVAGHTAEQATVTKAVVAGSPATQILRYARTCNADVIVLGSHGHGLMQRLMLGSVAERVMRHATCSVLLTPHRTGQLTSGESQAAAELGA